VNSISDVPVSVTHTQCDPHTVSGIDAMK